MPYHTSITSPQLNYNQQFNFTSNFNKSATDTIQINPYLRSITNYVINTYSYFNVTNFLHQTGSIVTFSITVNYSVVQRFCLSIVLCNMTELKAQTLLNASYTQPATINSVDPANNLGAFVGKNFRMLPVYGPNYNYKCVIGFQALKVVTYGSYHSVYFDFTITPNLNASYSNSSDYSLTFTTFCFVQLQCQYLYQQYYVIINDCQDTCTLSNCLDCSTATSCSKCESGFFVNSLLRC